MDRPHCPNCSKPIPYQTDCIYAPRSKDSMSPMPGWAYTENMIVTAKRYIDVPMADGKMERRLWSVQSLGWRELRAKTSAFLFDLMRG